MFILPDVNYSVENPMEFGALVLARKWYTDLIYSGTESVKHAAKNFGVDAAALAKHFNAVEHILTKRENFRKETDAKLKNFITQVRGNDILIGAMLVPATYEYDWSNFDDKKITLHLPSDFEYFSDIIDSQRSKFLPFFHNIFGNDAMLMIAFDAPAKYLVQG